MVLQTGRPIRQWGTLTRSEYNKECAKVGWEISQVLTERVIVTRVQPNRKRSSRKRSSRKRSSRKRARVAKDRSAKADVQRIREDAEANGFELYDAGRMGLGLRTVRPISKNSSFPYTGKVIQLDVDSETGRYVGMPEDCSYTADFTTADGRAFVVDALDLRVRNFTAYANHGGKHAKNARLLVTEDDRLVLQMEYDTPAGVPVYLDYGTKYVTGLTKYRSAPTDAWETPSAANGHHWVCVIE